MILEHTTTDGKTKHQVDLVDKKHVITNLEDNSMSTKKWGTQQKFVEKLIVKEIEKIESKIYQQKVTIGECIRYNKLEGIENTESRIKKNESKLDYLKSYVY